MQHEIELIVKICCSFFKTYLQIWRLSNFRTLGRCAICFNMVLLVIIFSLIKFSFSSWKEDKPWLATEIVSYSAMNFVSLWFIKMFEKYQLSVRFFDQSPQLYVWLYQMMIFYLYILTFWNVNWNRKSDMMFCCRPKFSERLGEGGGKNERKTVLTEIKRLISKIPFVLCAHFYMCACEWLRESEA